MKKIFLLFIFFSISINSLPIYSRSLNSLSYGSLKETILALDHTKKNSRKEIQQLSIQSPTSYTRKQIKEYTIFTDYLTYQINQYCDQIRKIYGSDKISGLPCDNYNGAESTENFSKQKQIKTSTEQSSELENEFMASLGDFDEMLLKEEEEISNTSRKKVNSSNSDTGSGSEQRNGSGKQGTGEIQNTNKSGQYGQTSSQKESTNQKQKGSFDSSSSSTTTNPVSRSGKSYGKQQSIGGGKGKGIKRQSAGEKKTSDRERRKLDEIDDDIVARQLKEAAEKETDPKLKEKLWEEYYKYKKNSLNQ